MTLTDYYVANTGEIVPGFGHITKQITPPPRRPDASGEQPLYVPSGAVGFDDRPRPDTTARIVTGSNWPGTAVAEEPRPRGYVGAHRARLARSRAALADAIARGRRDGA